MQQVKQDKSKTYNYTKSKWIKAFVNHCSKVKPHGLVEPPLDFISLSMDLLDPLDQQITDLFVPDKQVQTPEVQILAFKF